MQKKSGGPKTPHGKARAAKNSTKHGLLSTVLRFADTDEQSAYEHLREDVERSFLTTTPLEDMLVDKIAFLVETPRGATLHTSSVGNHQQPGSASCSYCNPEKLSTSRIARAGSG
jgi:hypothetical protein